MGYVLALLREMRRRPGMYIGVPSTIRLAAFVRGYDYAAMQLSGKAPDPFLPAFRDWVYERFGPRNESWEHIILQNSADDADAQERFWALLDEFLAQRGSIFKEGSMSANEVEFAPAADHVLEKNAELYRRLA
jgi:hypothetical protein